MAALGKKEVIQCNSLGHKNNIERNKEMRGNSFGKLFSFVTFGESHGPAYGVVIDGVPSGLIFSLSDLQKCLDRRAPGKIAGTTSRNEADQAEVLSGIFEGKTLGTPIAVLVRNTNQKSEDYDKLKTENRPGHADETTLFKFGIRDHRGSGRASGRETLCRVIAGYFASLLLSEVKVKAFVSKIGPFVYSGVPDDLEKNFAPYSFPNLNETDNIKNFLVDLQKKGDSIGGKVLLVIDKVPKGLGEPVYDKLKADLAKAMMSIGAVTSFSYGLGEQFSEFYGSEVSNNRDNFGGIEGGISNGQRILITLTFKPTSTIGEKAKEGRHDPCIIPRAIPVVEAMAKVVLADHLLRQNAYR